MKSFLTPSLLILITAFSVNAQEVSQTLAPLLNSYYEIKNALVQSDAATASVKASEFNKTINSVDTNKLTANELTSFMSFQEKLSLDAGNIAATTDLAKQRKYFAGFSLNFYTLAKALKLSDKPVYLQYCPMKNASWLSDNKVIQNPYYGSAMLTCGSDKETF